jgi:hypothetical protein
VTVVLDPLRELVRIDLFNVHSKHVGAPSGK